MPIDWNTITICLTIAASFGSGGFLASRFISKEINDIKTIIIDIKDVLSEKITAHDFADQKQFEAIRNRIAIVETKTEINRHNIQGMG